MNATTRLILLTLTAAIGCSVLAAAPAPAPNPAQRPSTNAADRARRRLMKTGGIIRRAGSAHGKIVFLNAQRAVPTDELSKIALPMRIAINPIYEIRDVERVTAANPSGDIRAAGGNVGVALVDEDVLPALSAAPEEGWAVVNVRPLKKGDPKPEVLASRVRKEVMRGLALCAGAAYQSRDPEVHRGDVMCAADLDLIPREYFGIDTMNAMRRQLAKFGVTPWQEDTYKHACLQGWAPPPTNEFQKAVWDKVHAIPKNPMKIEFDPKKGR